MKPLLITLMSLMALLTLSPLSLAAEVSRDPVEPSTPINSSERIDSSKQDDGAINLGQLFTQEANVEQLARLATRLSLGADTRGNFKQARHLKVLKKPLLSQGGFIFSPQKGLVWRQTAPFSNTLVLADKQLIQQDSRGQIRVSNANSSSAIAEKLPQLFHAILTGNIELLSNDFTLYVNEQANQWSLGLRPNDIQLQQAIGYMVLSGAEEIHSLTMLSQLPMTHELSDLDEHAAINADFTLIEFTHIEQGPLSSAEQAWFSLTLAPKPE